MKKTAILFFFSLITSACYQQVTLDGFDKEKWVKNANRCDNYRLDMSTLLLENKDILLEKTQNEVESLLGKAAEHELYQRNQKYFHYRLTPPGHCGNQAVRAYLSIRFNALGRSNLIEMTYRE